MMTTDRNEFVGGFVTSDVKQKVREEAKKQNLSVSLYLYKLLCEKLGVPEAA